MSKFIVIIPAFNAARSLPVLIERIRTTYPHLEVLVVDDGSTDGSGEIARRHGARVVEHADNRGKGAALASGFKYALVGGFDAAITLDADLQHDPDEIQTFLDFYDGAGVVLIGERVRDTTMPIERKLSNSLSSFAASIFAGYQLRDAQSGFRMIPATAMKRVQPRSQNYDFEPEFLIRAARAGFAVRGVPIRTIYNGSTSAIRPLLDTFRFLKMLARSVFWIA